MKDKYKQLIEECIVPSTEQRRKRIEKLVNIIIVDYEKELQKERSYLAECNKECNSLLNFLYEIRQVVGDNGEMMQKELLDHLKNLAKEPVAEFEAFKSYGSLFINTEDSEEVIKTSIGEQGKWYKVIIIIKEVE